jgi:hypothetical protein
MVNRRPAADRRPPLRLIEPSTSPEEAAAIVAAIEQFVRAHAHARAGSEQPDEWLRAAMLDSVARANREDAREPWINT